MEKSLLILFFGIVLCGKVFGKLEMVSTSKNEVKTSTADFILISVETSHLIVEISMPSVSVILPGAFKKSTGIKYLTLNFTKGPILFGKDSFKELRDLQKLYFGDSLITLYYDTFEYMQNLASIHMSLSEVTTEIANKFDNLHYLEELRIKSGHLENIKAYTFHSNNKNMKILELSSCSIFLIEPKAFAALINLVTLDLSNNTLMRIAPGTFDGLSKLQTLNLKNNNLYKIGEAAFNGLAKLVTLDMSYNDLIDIALTAFYNLKIGDFTLNNNRLKTIAKGLFNYPNSNITQNIYLQNNFIDKIDSGAFTGPKINILNLAGNPLKQISRQVSQELQQYARSFKQK